MMDENKKVIDGWRKLDMIRKMLIKWRDKKDDDRMV